MVGLGWALQQFTRRYFYQTMHRESLRVSDYLIKDLCHPRTFSSSKQILHGKRGNLGRDVVNTLFLGHGTRSEIMTIVRFAPDRAVDDRCRNEVCPDWDNNWTADLVDRDLMRRTSMRPSSWTVVMEETIGPCSSRRQNLVPRTDSHTFPIRWSVCKDSGK